METESCYHCPTKDIFTLDVKNGIIVMKQFPDLITHRRNSWKYAEEELKKEGIASATFNCEKCGGLIAWQLIQWNPGNLDFWLIRKNLPISRVNFLYLDSR